MLQATFLCLAGQLMLKLPPGEATIQHKCPIISQVKLNKLSALGNCMLIMMLEHLFQTFAVQLCNKRRSKQLIGVLTGDMRVFHALALMCLPAGILIFYEALMLQFSGHQARKSLPNREMGSRASWVVI